jgi:magnesium and cobalt exporter, CNNM family
LDDFSTSALLGILAVLLLVSAFFSLSETSMMALNRYRLRHLVKQGNPGARLTSELLAQTDRLLGVILLGNNLLNAAIALLVGEMARRMLGESELSLVAATGAATFAILVFSEITPKVVGASYAEQIALPSSYVLAPLLKVASPVVWFVNLFVRALLSLTRLEQRPEAGAPKLTAEELKTLVLEGGNFVPQKHQSILVNLFDLESITVDDVMVPRHQVEAIDLDAEPALIRSQIATSYHTRLPVYQATLDNVVGMLHVRAVLNRMYDGDIDAPMLRKIMREPYYIPAGTPLFTQLQHFQENQARVGLVVDEYGEIKGLVTLEDIVEEIIGEFTTQSPLQTGGFAKQADGSWLVEGGASLRELNRKLGLRLPLDGPRTLNGLILEYFQDIPESGTSLKISDHPIEIVQTQDRVVKVARIYPPLPAR